MAKSSKVEDYWREHQIEILLKELTQLLVRRMPSDPALAIVEHLQKKFPKSFKTSTDNTGILSKTLANNLQRQSITSTRSDVLNESLNDVQTRRRSSNQSQTMTMPTVGSAFNDLLKQDTNSLRLAPELNIKNLVFANRLIQQGVKMRKDILSDHDILEEEVIKPNQTKAIKTNASIDFTSEDLQNSQTYEEPSVPQLIKYKQQIRTENDRRLHREKLAELAKYQRNKEQSIRSDLSTKPEEIEQQKFDYDQSLSPVIIPEETKNHMKSSHQPIVKSKEEEDILNDENVFQPKKYRDRARQRNKLPTPRANTPYIPAQQSIDVRSTLKRGDEKLVCKVCGNPVNGEDNQAIVYSQDGSAAPISRSFQPQPSSQSVETTSDAVDDWFEPATNESARRQSSSWAPDDVIPPVTGSSTFRRSLFQSTNDSVEHRPAIRPLILTDDDEIKIKQTLSPGMSEIGVSARSPEPKTVRPSSSSRSSTSPATKKHQTDTNHPLAQTISSTNDRRMSSSSVREHSPEDSNEN